MQKSELSLYANPHILLQMVTSSKLKEAIYTLNHLQFNYKQQQIPSKNIANIKIACIP